MKKLFLIAALASLSATSFAEEVYTAVGTTGFVLGASKEFSENLTARIEGNYLNYGRNFDSSDVKYDAKIKMSSLGLYADYFPFGSSSSGFRLTAGAMIGKDKVTGNGVANSNGTFTINGTEYSAAGESINVEAKFPNVRPYAGIGYGHTISKGFGFIADLGVAYGKASVNLNASQGLVNAAGQANIDAERNSAQDTLNKYKFYPVAKVGFAYTF
ncbi:hypothetical protein BUE93_22030 [Chromobacterium amazonense]|uniref:Outer membrane protein beta-barrel domain-containing protein n=1 Tax=Chromobacterium amazonense TaxID=1382803 RepID=A0A2S9WYE7_9NEIS|nr:autotransporter outer membrane beta-barrel domain-containing protein [Chromobacterium amazonense]PRP68483.1 hypothetical protein BUE93_22030 [Chromobacterium amazonense]